MKGYIIVSIGNSSEEDYICATGYGDHVRKVFLKKKTAEEFCKSLQTDYDIDDPENPYEFKLEKVEIVKD